MQIYILNACAKKSYRYVACARREKQEEMVIRGDNHADVAGCYFYSGAKI